MLNEKGTLAIQTSVLLWLSQHKFLLYLNFDNSLINLQNFGPYYSTQLNETGHSVKTKYATKAICWPHSFKVRMTITTLQFMNPILFNPELAMNSNSRYEFHISFTHTILAEFQRLFEAKTKELQYSRNEILKFHQYSLYFHYFF